MPVNPIYSVSLFVFLLTISRLLKKSLADGFKNMQNDIANNAAAKAAFTQMIDTQVALNGFTQAQANQIIQLAATSTGQNGNPRLQLIAVSSSDFFLSE